MTVSQDSWIERLTPGGATQAAALTELGQILQRRLAAAFRGHSSVDDALIEDIVQDALIRILEVLEQFEGRSSFTTWATTIAIRLAYSELRRRRWKDVSLNEMVERGGEFLPAPDHTQPGEISEQRTKLVKIMYRVIHEELTENRREALLAELAGLPLEEIGRRTGRNRNAIYKLTHDARKQLKKGLEAAGINASDLWSLRGN